VPDARTRLVASRPAATRYAETLHALSRDITSIEGRVERLAVYPVKALGAAEAPALRVTPLGLVEPATGLADRAAMLVLLRSGEQEGQAFDGLALTNRLEGALSLARGRIEGARVVYEAPGVESCSIGSADLAPRDGPTLRALMWGGGPILEGVPVDGPLTTFVRALLRAHPRRARRFDPDSVVAVVPPTRFRRGLAPHTGERAGAQTLYSDGGSFLVASSSTLAWMNDDLRKGGERAIDMMAFRPNVVLDGLPPNTEDIIGALDVAGPEGNVPIEFASFSIRCDATRVDLGTGDKPDRQPLAWLARERPPREDDGSTATFAINAVAAREGVGRSLRVGDAFRVRAERP